MKMLARSKDQKDWKILESAKYEAETELQKLLAESPGLISVQEVRPGAGTLAAVVREFPLPVGSIDLLAFSEQGDIAIIECKLASNPEVKRKVIGQVLDYGAHLWKMSYNELDDLVSRRENKSLAELMRETLQYQDWDEESFRENVEATLESGSFILIIVVDEINEELTNIVNFMNACGNPSFSFSALEMRRFQSDQLEMLYPRVVGDNRLPTQPASPSKRKQWSETMFFTDANERCEASVVEEMKKLYAWAREAGSVNFGTGISSGSYTYYKEKDGKKGSIFSVYSNGTISLNFRYMEKVLSMDEIAQFKLLVADVLKREDIKTTTIYYYNLPISEAFSTPKQLDKFVDLVREL